MLIKLSVQAKRAEQIYSKHMKEIGLKKASVSYGFIAVQNKRMIASNDKKKLIKQLKH